jgi:DNA-binding NarL/FixJ family response regulator
MHVLIADPDSRTRQAFTLLLQRRLGVRSVDEAWDLPSLERQLATCTPDLLLLDCDLPDLSTAETATLALRSTVGRLVLMSVDAEDATMAATLCAPFIYKGALPDEVLATLRSLIPA